MQALVAYRDANLIPPVTNDEISDFVLTVDVKLLDLYHLTQDELAERYPQHGSILYFISFTWPILPVRSPWPHNQWSQCTDCLAGHRRRRPRRVRYPQHSRGASSAPTSHSLRILGTIQSLFSLNDTAHQVDGSKPQSVPSWLPSHDGSHNETATP